MRFCQSLMYAPASDWIELARCAEEAGFEQVSLSDHVFHPAKLESRYPYSADGRPVFDPDHEWPDVWVMAGALAAATERILVSTHVYILPARNPLLVAKAAGTAAWATGGRLLLGVGAGWMREEFDALGQPFDRRGARMEEQIEVLRTLLSGGGVHEHHGTFYDFGPLSMAPVPAEPVPILIGGESDVALRRAARIGDGWMGTQYRLSELRGHVERLQRHREELGTAGRPFEIQAALVDRAPTPDVCAELEEMGVTTLITSAWLMAGLTFAGIDDNKRAIERFAAKYIHR